jgi:hypothetical protein
MGFAQGTDSDGSSPIFGTHPFDAACNSGSRADDRAQHSGNLRCRHFNPAGRARARTIMPCACHGVAAMRLRLPPPRELPKFSPAQHRSAVASRMTCRAATSLLSAGQPRPIRGHPGGWGGHRFARRRQRVGVTVSSRFTRRTSTTALHRTCRALRQVKVADAVGPYNGRRHHLLAGAGRQHTNL